jgi:hypothetical protein
MWNDGTGDRCESTIENGEEAQKSKRPFIQARVNDPIPLVLRLLVLTAIRLFVAKLPALVIDCPLVKLPIRPHCPLHPFRRLRKILNSHLFPILLDNARDKHQILALGELVQEYKVIRIHGRVYDVLLLIRVLGAWHRLQPLCAVFGRLVKPERDEGGWNRRLSAAGGSGLVDFGACGQVVVGIGRDLEVPARFVVAVVCALKDRVEILLLLTIAHVINRPYGTNLPPSDCIKLY